MAGGIAEWLSNDSASLAVGFMPWLTRRRTRVVSTISVKGGIIQTAAVFKYIGEIARKKQMVQGEGGVHEHADR
jgi:hypothetical protein